MRTVLEIDDQPRCWWSADDTRIDPLMVRYHDEEWGVRTHDDRELFQRLALESFQAGLSWSTILHKREAFRRAFQDFEPAMVAAFDDGDRARLMADAGIVRNRAKIDATIANAAGVLMLQKEFGSFDAYLQQFAEDPPRSRHDDATLVGLPSHTPQAAALSADLRRRGFRFVGPTVVYSFMQSVGLVDDHLPGCFRYAQPDG